MWDDKVAAAGKAWEDQVKAVTDSAEAALDAGISKVSAVVRRCACAVLLACSAGLQGVPACLALLLPGCVLPQLARCGSR